MDGYGNVKSFSGLLSDKSPIYPPEIADYIVEHGNALGCDEIRDILDSDDFSESVNRGKRYRVRSESIRRNRRK